MKENMLIIKIRDNYKYFGGLSLVYGLIFTFCLYKNLSGITFPVCIGVTIVFAILFMKKINYKIMKHSLPYMAGMILLGISSAFTTSVFLHIFNIVGILLLLRALKNSHFFCWEFSYSYINSICVQIYSKACKEKSPITA